MSYPLLEENLILHGVSGVENSFVGPERSKLYTFSCSKFIMEPSVTNGYFCSVVTARGVHKVVTML